MANNKNLTDQKYWEENFGQMRPFKFSKVPLHEYYEKYLPENKDMSCIEIGAHPGIRLGYFAKEFGYKPTALDFIDEVKFVEANMRFNGIKNCEVIVTDFLKWEPKQKFDVVCSFGFVEHFENYEEVIEKHLAILKKGGFLIISVPYLEYFQLWIRKMLYTDKQLSKILDSHNRKIMQLDELKRLIFDSEHRMEEVFAGFVKGMSIWFAPTQDVIKMNRKWLYGIFKQVERLVNKVNISNKYISPEILIIAKKN